MSQMLVPDDDTLEFVIKSYPDHEGATAQVPDLSIGDTASLDGPFGAITDRGPGVFLAAGAGITPFIPILRKHDREGLMDGCTLIFSNKTEADIIMQHEDARNWQGPRIASLSAVPGLLGGASEARS